MSHLIKLPGEKRVSLDSIHLVPNGKVQIGYWGVIPNLELIATDDLDWQEDIKRGLYRSEDAPKFLIGTKVPESICKPVPVPTPNRSDILVKEFSFKKAGKYRIVLKYGDQVWDWMRIYCDPKKPAIIDENSAVSDGVLNVDFVWAVAEDKVGINFLPHAMTVCRLLAEKHGFKVRFTPENPAYDSSRRLRGYEDGIVCDSAIGNMRGVAIDLNKDKKLYRDAAVTILMANARLVANENKDPGTLAGQTVQKSDGAIGNPFVILNLNNAAIDGATLLHEMGHAAGFCDHATAGSHFMSYGPRRNEVTQAHVKNFHDAFFRSEA